VTGTPDHTGQKLPSWRITLIRNRSGVRIGTVEAATAEEAIKIAIRQYGITDPERQRRLVAQRIERT
jgi:hypothetical protein